MCNVLLKTSKLQASQFISFTHRVYFNLTQYANTVLLPEQLVFSNIFKKTCSVLQLGCRSCSIRNAIIAQV